MTVFMTRPGSTTRTGEEVLGTTPAFDRNEDVDERGLLRCADLAEVDGHRQPCRSRRSSCTRKLKRMALPFADVDAENMETPRYFDSEEPGEDEWWIGSVVINWSMDGGDLTSTTAYYERDVSEYEEEHTFLDFIYGAAVGIPITHRWSPPLETTSEYENFTHETRFTSSNDGPWNYTVGILYADGEFHSRLSAGAAARR